MQKQKLALAIDDKAAAALQKPEEIYLVGENAIRCQPPYVHNEIGVLYLQENKLDSALYHFNTAAILAPNWAIPQSNLAIVHRRGGKLDQAMRNANRAFELKSDYPKAQVNLGNIWLDKHNILKAETAFRQAISIDKQFYLAYERMGQLMVLRTEYGEANWFFNEAEKLKKGNLPTIFKDEDADGVIDMIDQEPDFAEGVTIKFFEKEPTTETEFLERGIYFFKLGSYTSAEHYLRGVLDFNTENKEVYEYLGRTLYHLHRYEEAELALNKLLKLRPNEPALKLFLADVFIKQQRRLEEDELYIEILDKSPAPSDLAKQVYERMDNLLQQMRRYPEQEKWLVEYEAFYKNTDNKLYLFYGKMAQTFPQNPDWLYRFAAHLIRQDRDAGAAYYFKEIVALDAAYPPIAYMHERIGANTEAPQTAIWHFKEALRLDSSMVAAK